MNRTGKIIRTVAGSAVLGFILICLSVSGSVSKAGRNNTLCSGIAVTIRDSTENRFVTEADVREFIDVGYGKAEGIPINDLDLKKIENILDSQSAVLKSEAYCTKDGLLNISITQRKPIMRFQKNGARFYADGNGYIFPMKSGRSSYVIVIDGEIPLKLDSAGRGRSVTGKEGEWLEKITGVVTYMNDHRVWADNIVQIHVQKNGELLLIPREGKEKFIFGKPDHVGEKFSRMEKYYTAIVPAKGQGHYNRVDVRYDDQIICK